MEEKYNEATPQRLEDHLIDAPLVPINLDNFIEQLKGESSWKDSDRNSITVFKTNGLRIQIIALHEGAEMPTHSVDGHISLQVIEGKIKFVTEEQTLELGKGHMLALHEQLPHSVIALKESVLILTLTTSLEGK